VSERPYHITPKQQTKSDDFNAESITQKGEGPEQAILQSTVVRGRKDLSKSSRGVFQTHILPPTFYQLPIIIWLPEDINPLMKAEPPLSNHISIAPPAGDQTFNSIFSYVYLYLYIFYGEVPVQIIVHFWIEF
jgi:hypothetical protein